ncbi:MAG: hypothetical protein PF488_00790 [Patescibacteria group bacterium]|jgi:hypothetical protein|nr:hypothetical protein [Patescibacteria group bacterium]
MNKFESLNINDNEEKIEKVEKKEEQQEKSEQQGKQEQEKNTFKTGFESYKDIPGYPENHKGHDKYESLLKLKEQEENNIENPEVLSYDKKMKEVLSEKEKENETTLSKVRNITKNKAFKAALLSLMLLSKAGGLSAENFRSEELKEGEKIEMEKNNEDKTLESEDTYVSEYKEFDEKVKLEATNYFETDKAEISQENQEKLEKDLSKFLNTIDEDNFDDLIAKKWVVKGSSDQRETMNWGGSNKNLTKARIDVVRSTIEEVINSNDFSEKLSEEQIEEIKSKEIKEKYPTHNEEEKEDGVTYLTDLENEKTDEKYTVSEINEIAKYNPKKYQELLETCRFTNFEIESNYFELEKFDRVFYLVDESGSMQASKYFISEKLEDIDVDNKPIEFYSYSDLLNPERVNSCDNSQEASEKIKQRVEEGSFRERQIDATMGLVNKAVESNKESGNKYEQQKIFVATDEAFQGFSSKEIEILQKKAKDNNIEIEFLSSYQEIQHNYIAQDNELNVVRLSINELAKKVESAANEKNKNNRLKQEKHQSSERIDEFYQNNYEDRASSFEVYVKNYENDAFFTRLKSKGYGETPTEIRENLEKEFAGAKNFKKLTEFINEEVKNNTKGENLRNLIDYTVMGNGNREDRQFADALKRIARPLRELIESRNKLDLINETVEDMDKDELPTMTDNVYFENFNDIIDDSKVDYKMPVHGASDLLSNLEY